MYRTLNPATGEIVQEYSVVTDEQINETVERAQHAFTEWRTRTFLQRAALFERIAALLEERSERYAALMALEMGKPLAQGRSEIESCALICREIAGEAERLLSPQAVLVDEGDARVRYEPLGVVLGIMPWNFPFRQVFRYAVPALMAGNVTILKHAPNVPQCANALVELFRDAQAAPGVFETIFAANEQIERIIADPRVRGVTLTGSVRAGEEIGALAGRHGKPMVLELGGNDPFIVCGDADLDAVVPAAVGFRCLNNGQSCISPKRFLIERSLFEKFKERFIEGMQARRVGDPMLDDTENGPMAREDLRTALVEQIGRLKEEGAEVHLGGDAVEGPGFYMAPTVVSGVQRDGVAFREELFGPVGVLVPFDSDEEAISLANDTPYGLGATVWSRSRERATRISMQLETGVVFVNGTTKSDPRVPFGGVKRSGVGRELGREGIRAFTNVKTIWVR